MAVKGAKTINEYKILKWIDENFVHGSVSVEFLSETSAVITDCNNETMKLTLVDNEVIAE